MNYKIMITAQPVFKLRNWCTEKFGVMDGKQWTIDMVSVSKDGNTHPVYSFDRKEDYEAFVAEFT